MQTPMRVGGAYTLPWRWAEHTHSHEGGWGMQTPMRVGGGCTFLDYTGLRLGNGHAEVGVAISHMEVGVASSHMEVVCATYILPCPHRSCTMWMGQYRPM